MKFKIIHQTDYVFDSVVKLEPHYLRFRPRRSTSVNILDFSISVASKPAGHRRIRDEENNIIDFFWFEGITEQLSITSTTILETTPFNPFNFILYPKEFNQLPFEYAEPRKRLLNATLQKKPISDELLDYGNALLKKSDFNTITYLTALTSKICNDFKVLPREVGQPFSPERTFKHKKGSCRDLTWMQIILLRQQGIASRFVSGYYYCEMDNPNYELHAWLEVFLPGAGWIGLDPSYGILTCETHFPIASSANPLNTMPVSGGIRGSASSKLKTELSIEKIA